METTLSQATKYSLSIFTDRFNAIGSPSIELAQLPNSGEGSSFLSVPTKRNILTSTSLLSSGDKESIAPTDSLSSSEQSDFDASNKRASSSARLLRRISHAMLQPTKSFHANSHRKSTKCNSFDFKAFLSPHMASSTTIVPSIDVSAGSPKILADKHKSPRHSHISTTSEFPVTYPCSPREPSNSSAFTQQMQVRQQSQQQTDQFPFPTKPSASLALPTDQQWHQLNQLRIHAGAPERTERGIDRLMHYYAQLQLLEERFAFGTQQVFPSPLSLTHAKLSVEFCWYEAFFVKRKIVTDCIHYEKAAVLWNIGALYSQLGATQSLWAVDGLKMAADFFQRASGAFVYIRNTLHPRFLIQIDTSSDLSEATLTAASELMLSQAAECFYQKAEFDHTSSPVTSQIAVQCADFYDIAYKTAKQNNEFGKYRFPKAWPTHIRTKQMLYTACAHLHCPNFLAPDMVVGERHSRLLLALELCQAALGKCTSSGAPSTSPELRVLAASVLDRLNRALDDVDKANYDSFHQTVIAREKLKPLRRPPHALVASIDVVAGSGDQMAGPAFSNPSTIQEGIKQGRFVDILHSVAAPLSSHQPTAGGPATSDVHNASILMPCRVLDGVTTSTTLSDDLKLLEWNLKRDQDRCTTELSRLVREQEQMQPLPKPHAPTTFVSHGELIGRGRQLLTVLEADEREFSSESSIHALFSTLQHQHDMCTKLLDKSYSQLWDNSEHARSYLVHEGKHSSAASLVQKLMDARMLVRQLKQLWHGGEKEFVWQDGASKGMESNSKGGDSSSSGQTIVESLRLGERRQRLLELEIVMTQEPLTDLFDPRSAKGGWSVAKIRLMLPCVDERWSDDCEAFWIAATNKLQQCRDILHAIGGSGARLSEAQKSFTASATTTTIAQLHDAFISMAQQYRDNLDGPKSQLLQLNKSFQDMRERLNHLQQNCGSSGENAVTLDRFNLLDEGRKSHQRLLQELEKVQQRMQVLRSGSTVLEQVLFPEDPALVSFSYLLESMRESESAMKIFGHQLSVLQDFRVETHEEIHKMERINAWLRDTFHHDLNALSESSHNSVSIAAAALESSTTSFSPPLPDCQQLPTASPPPPQPSLLRQSSAAPTSNPEQFLDHQKLLESHAQLLHQLSIILQQHPSPHNLPTATDATKSSELLPPKSLLERARERFTSILSIHHKSPSTSPPPFQSGHAGDCVASLHSASNNFPIKVDARLPPPPFTCNLKSKRESFDSGVGNTQPSSRSPSDFPLLRPLSPSAGRVFQFKRKSVKSSHLQPPAPAARSMATEHQPSAPTLKIVDLLHENEELKRRIDRLTLSKRNLSSKPHGKLPSQPNREVQPQPHRDRSLVQPTASITNFVSPMGGRGSLFRHRHSSPTLVTIRQVVVGDDEIETNSHPARNQQRPSSNRRSTTALTGIASSTRLHQTPHESVKREFDVVNNRRGSELASFLAQKQRILTTTLPSDKIKTTTDDRRHSSLKSSTTKQSSPPQQFMHVKDHRRVSISSPPSTIPSFPSHQTETLHSAMNYVSRYLAWDPYFRALEAKRGVRIDTAAYIE